MTKKGKWTLITFALAAAAFILFTSRPESGTAGYLPGYDRSIALIVLFVVIMFFKFLPENIMGKLKKPGSNYFRFIPSVVLILFTILPIFYIMGGYDAAATWGLGMSGFLILLLGAVALSDKEAERASHGTTVSSSEFTNTSANSTYSDGTSGAAGKNSFGPFALLGVLWLLAIPFAPFLLMLVDSLYTMTPVNWKTVLGIKAFLCIGIPLIGVLPLLQYIPGKSSALKALILAIGTAFPMFFGWHSLLDLIQGTKKEQVTVASVENMMFKLKGRSAAETGELKVHLADGRIFDFNKINGNIPNGPADIEYLEYTNTILSAR